MKPLLTMSEEKMEFARYIADGNGPESVFRQVVAELDAQRAVPSPEPVEAEIDGWYREGRAAAMDESARPESCPYERTSSAGSWWSRGFQWAAANLDRARLKADAAAVRRQAIEDCIQKVFEASYAVQHSDRERCDTEELVRALEALREGESGKGVE